MDKASIIFKTSKTGQKILEKQKPICIKHIFFKFRKLHFANYKTSTKDKFNSSAKLLLVEK